MSAQVFQPKTNSYWLISDRQITAIDLKALVIKNCQFCEILHTYAVAMYLF